MIYIISYDIPKDAIRNKIARLCKMYAFARMQYSVFIGKTSRTQVETLALRAEEILGKKKGKIVIIPVCQKCFEKVISLRNSPPSEKKPSLLSFFGKKAKKKVIVA